MNTRLSRFLAGVAGLWLVFFAAGCDRAKPPEPVALGDVPRVLRDAFRDAGGEVRQMADSLVSAVEQQQWTQASVGLQALSEQKALSDKQRNEVARCLIAVNAQVAEAAAAGDAQAGQLQQLRRTDK